MGLEDPAGACQWKNLSTTNLPNPINFLITAGVNDDDDPSVPTASG